MYLIQCPACGKQMQSPFVRVGAVTRCGSCNHRFTIHANHVQRMASESATAGSPPVSPTTSAAGIAPTSASTLASSTDSPASPASAEPARHEPVSTLDAGADSTTLIPAAVDDEVEDVIFESQLVAPQIPEPAPPVAAVSVPASPNKPVRAPEPTATQGGTPSPAPLTTNPSAPPRAPVPAPVAATASSPVVSPVASPVASVAPTLPASASSTVPLIDTQGKPIAPRPPRRGKAIPVSPPPAARSAAPAATANASPSATTGARRQAAPNTTVVVAQGAPTNAARDIAHRIRLKQKQRQQRTLIALSTIFLGMLVLVTAGYFYRFSSSASSASPKPGTLETEDAASSAALAKIDVDEFVARDPSLPILSSINLSPSEWTSVPAGPFDTYSSSVITLINESVDESSPAYVKYSAEVNVTGIEPFDQATVTLWLENAEGIPTHFTRISLALVGVGLPQSVRSSIPRDLWTQSPKLRYRITSGTLLTGAVWIADPILDVHGVNRRFALKVTAYNPAELTLTRTVFLVSALDANDQPLQQWRIDWTKPVDPKQRIEFVTVLSSPEPLKVRKWELIGAAQSSQVESNP